MMSASISSAYSRITGAVDIPLRCARTTSSSPALSRLELTRHAALGDLLEPAPDLFGVREVMRGVVGVVRVQDDRVQHVEDGPVLLRERQRVIERRVRQRREIGCEQDDLQ